VGTDSTCRRGSGSMGRGGVKKAGQILPIEGKWK